MKYSLHFRFILPTLLLCSNLWSQHFVWMRGSTVGSAAGTFGTQNISSPTNDPPCRMNAVSWTDANGNLWLFGGFNDVSSGNRNDLWMYNRSTNQWTWKKGSNTVGQYGIYGTLGVSSPANVPGARYGSVGWTDTNGNLWLFGGFGYTATNNAYLNDLWKYNIAANGWTWMGGSNGLSQYGVYGTQGVPTASVWPGGHAHSTAWTDPAGNFYFFGGYGAGASSTSTINDLWRYNISSGMWTWMSGSSVVGDLGVYGTLGVPSSTIHPGARERANGWRDASGNLWLYGGSGATDVISWPLTNLNDLWKFNVNTAEWTFVHGTNLGNQPVVYGTKDLASPANTPGGRHGCLTWVDGAGNFLLFGGFKFQSLQFYYNDLWSYSRVTNEWTWKTGSNLTNQNGTFGAQGIGASNNVPGGRYESVGWKDNAGGFWLFGGSHYYQPNQTWYMNDLWSFADCAETKGSISATKTIFCKGDQIKLQLSASSTQTWNQGSVTTSIIITPSLSGTYSAVATQTNGCVFDAAITLSLTSCTGLNDQQYQAKLLIFPNPNTSNFSINADSDFSHLEIFDLHGKQLYFFENKGKEITVRLPQAGIYYCRGKDSHGTYQFVKIIVTD